MLQPTRRGRFVEEAIQPVDTRLIQRPDGLQAQEGIKKNSEFRP